MLGGSILRFLSGKTEDAPQPAAPAAPALSLKEQLIAAQDKSALDFIREVTETDNHGAFKVTLPQRVRVFDQVTDWLMKRERLVKTDDGDDPVGIEVMREMMASKLAGAAAIPPKRRPGRPTKAESAAHELMADARERQKRRVNGAKPADDSGLQKLIKGAN